jgi:hypothetical protein
MTSPPGADESDQHLQAHHPSDAESRLQWRLELRLSELVPSHPKPSSRALSVLVCEGKAQVRCAGSLRKVPWQAVVHVPAARQTNRGDWGHGDHEHG